MSRRSFRDERGAETLEFALVAPVLLFLVFGLIYAGFAAAAHLSLAHAASVGVRYASLPTDPVAGVYPSPADVQTRVLDSTPFFSPDNCTTTVNGTNADNSPVMLDVACDFPNPAGEAITKLRDLITGASRPDGYNSTLHITAHAEARRE